jgi:hypothetical protein
VARRGVSDATVLERYLVSAGTLRFGIEFPVAFGLGVAHLVSIVFIALGGMMLLVAHPTGRTVASGSRLS